jgi:FMN-dependent NADH-azoreductase
VLAAPINWFNVTALMKRFIERLICYGYWPWNGGYPKNRIKKLTKKAVLITSSSAPAWFGRIFFHGTFSVLKAVSKCLGAKVVRKIYIGGAAISPEQPLSRKYKEQACAAGKALVN